MYPITISNEIENDSELELYFHGMKRKVDDLLNKLVHYFNVNKSIQFEYFYPLGPREVIEQYTHLLVKNIDKILQFSEQIEDLKKKKIDFNLEIDKEELLKDLNS